MEMLDLHSVDGVDFGGQRYGYILYRFNITEGHNLTFTEFPRDRIEVGIAKTLISEFLGYLLL